MILIVKHTKNEGPGYIQEFFENTDWPIRMIDLSAGDKLPGSLKAIEAVILMGGPMNVYQEKEFPFLEKEDLFLRRAIKFDIPILGICLGAQLIAKASGAKVSKAPREENGWHKIQLSVNALSDALFDGLGKTIEIFQWHEDMFAWPKNAFRLADSAVCPQAFRMKKNIYGLQFHVEATPEMIEEWGRAMKSGDKGNNMIIEAYRNALKHRRQAYMMLLNFSRVIERGN